MLQFRLDAAFGVTIAVIVFALSGRFTIAMAIAASAAASAPAPAANIFAFGRTRRAFGARLGSPRRVGFIICLAILDFTLRGGLVEAFA